MVCLPVLHIIGEADPFLYTQFAFRKTIAACSFTRLRCIPACTRISCAPHGYRHHVMFDTDVGHDGVPPLDRFYEATGRPQVNSPRMLWVRVMPILLVTGLAYLAWILVALLPDSSTTTMIMLVLAVFNGAMLAFAWASGPLPRIGSGACAAGLMAFAGAALVVQMTGGIYLAAPGKLAAAAFVAALLTTLFDRLSWVLIAAAVMTLTDLWSVYSTQGVTHLVTNAEEGSFGMALLAALSISVPWPGGGDGGMIGFVDAVFACLFVQVAVLWSLGVARTLIAIGMALAVMQVLLVTVLDELPALPGMSVAFCIAHGRMLVAASRDDIARSRSAR